MKKKIIFIFLLMNFLSCYLVADSGGLYLDPMRLGIGARTVGLGRTFTGLADDVNSLFYNPAGLTQFYGPQIMSMSTKILDEVNYLVYGGVIDTEYGIFGISYIEKAIQGIDVQSYQERANFNSNSSGSWKDSVIGISHARKFVNVPFFRKLSIGGTLKIFQAMLSGVDDDNLGEAVGSGYDMDIGLLVEPTRRWSIGLQFRDVLPKIMGGHMRFGETNDSIPCFIILGTAYRWDKDLLLGLDLEYSHHDIRPLLYRLGLEYQMMPYLQLRAGYDQIAKSSSNDELESSLTLGLGLSFFRIAFDYAYHPYTDLAENASHFFSLSWRDFREVEIELDIATKNIIVDTETITVKGRMKYAKESFVNLQWFDVDEQGYFSQEIPLSLGKNTLLFTAFGADKTRKEKIVNVLRLASFKDVTENTYAAKEIKYLGSLGIIEGEHGNLFKPNNYISRGEMTAIIYRLDDIEEEKRIVTCSTFCDVSTNYWAVPYIYYSCKSGYVNGFPDGSFRAREKLTNMQAVVVLSRIDNLIATKELDQRPFIDVPLGHWGVSSLGAAMAANRVDLSKKKRFRPKGGISRAELIWYLAGTNRGQKLIADLLDFSKGYQVSKRPDMY